MRIVALALLFSLLAARAHAVDGVLEINQALAIAGGVNGSTVSDPAGFPVVITQPGSYKLTGNLTVSDSNTTAIEVAASQVEIDLNGFSILGPNSCGGSPMTCSANGSGVGVHAPNPAHVGSRVHGGTVKGMGSAGVALQGWAHVSGLNIQSNGSTGIFAADHSIIAENRLILNGGSGIATATSCTVRDNHVASNGHNGIEVRSLTRVSQNLVRGNGSAGHCGIALSTIFEFGVSASQNSVFDNPMDCGGVDCCPVSGARLIDCNMIQAASGALQRCCPNPATGGDVCS